MIDRSIGPFLKQQRQSVNKSISEVCFEIGISTFSRFEHGIIDISNSRLLRTFDEIGVDYRDLYFHELLDGGFSANWAYTVDNDWNRQKVLELADEFKSNNVESSNAYFNLIQECLCELIAIHDNNQKSISHAIALKLDQYFMHVSFIGALDNRILISLLPYINVKQSYRWMLKLIECIANTNLNEIGTTVRLNTVLMVIEQALVANDFLHSRKLLDAIECLDLSTQQPLVIKYNYQYVRSAYELLCFNTTENRTKFAAVISATRLLFSEDLFLYFMNEAIDRGWLTQNDFHK